MLKWPGKSYDHMEDIYSVLFDRIISGEYPVQSKLNQEEIAREFNISRTPLRVVLQQLDQDGLIQLTPNKGAKVLPFTADEIEEIYEIRKHLELLCLDISAPVLSLQKLLELKNEIVENQDSDDVSRLTEMDVRLHSYIIQTAGKKRLSQILDQLFRLLQKFRRLGFVKEQFKIPTLEEHKEIIDALIIRDIHQSKELMRNHIENSKIRALSQLYTLKK
jgi:DNA-binding GntR family transcriptional regulator